MLVTWEFVNPKTGSGRPEQPPSRGTKKWRKIDSAKASSRQPQREPLGILPAACFLAVHRKLGLTPRSVNHSLGRPVFPWVHVNWIGAKRSGAAPSER